MRKSLEVWPAFPFEVICGSLNGCSFRVTKSGRNIVYEKTSKTEKKSGRDPNILKKASEKWAGLSVEKIQFWQDIADKYTFRTRWTAFVSSFFLSVDKHGLDYTMSNELSYIYSKKRLQKYKHFENSRWRNRQYQVNPEDYAGTEQIMAQYPIELFSEFIVVKLLDLDDVNLALRMAMVERGDPIVEYEFYPDDEGDGNTGRYVRRERVRTGEELYEPFGNTYKLE